MHVVIRSCVGFAGTAFVSQPSPLTDFTELSWCRHPLPVLTTHIIFLLQLPQLPLEISNLGKAISSHALAQTLPILPALLLAAPYMALCLQHYSVVTESLAGTSSVSRLSLMLSCRVFSFSVAVQALCA